MSIIFQIYDSTIPPLNDINIVNNNLTENGGWVLSHMSPAPIQIEKLHTEH